MHTSYYENFRKRVFNQIAFNHSSNIKPKNVMNLYRKDTAGPYSILVIAICLTSKTPLHFQNNLIE